MTTPKIVKGTRFRSVIQDASVLFETTRRLGKTAWEAVVVNEPDVDGNASDFAGERKAFLTTDIERALMMDAAFHRMQNAHEAAYFAFEIGQIVHYHNGFKEFVRCEVVIGTTERDTTSHKCLRPIALVGAWDSAGSRYYKQRINEGLCFEPHASNIYETPMFCRPNMENPADLPAL